jgi:hypothetical protein
MELRYMGFDQKQNTRTYRFERVAKGEPTILFVITADLALFLKHHVGIQEGPALCAHKLTAAEAIDGGDHQLTNEDILAYATACAAEGARKAEARRAGVRRRPWQHNQNQNREIPPH